MAALATVLLTGCSAGSSSPTSATGATAPPTENTTIEYTSPNGVDQITSAVAAAYAQKMAVLCTDVFAATS